MANQFADYLVIGGGLAGLTAAWILAKGGGKVLLIDRSLPNAGGNLGGFTGFSGAKFSLLPAGQGLIPVAGSVERTNKAIADVLQLFGISSRKTNCRPVVSQDEVIGRGAAIRTYESIVLNPYEIGSLIDFVSRQVRSIVTVLNAEVLDLRWDGREWMAYGAAGEIARAVTAICAGGRTSGALLRRAGAISQEGKGLDLGVRVEFMNRNALKGLRSRGPDAKILLGNTRTFCLNYPGEVYRYPFEGFSIPGGIVADPDYPRANFGLLTRVKGKQEKLDAMMSYLRMFPKETYEGAKIVKGKPFQEKASVIRSAYGAAAARELQSFAEVLWHEGLVDWQYEHKIHFPLLDWHWNIYGIGASHKTSQPNLFVAGDSAGHARGLLQAGVSGWLAAKEMLTDAEI